MSSDPTALLVRESRSLVRRLRLWTPARYAAVAPRPTLHGLATRGDVVHHLAQALADRAAELEGQPSRPLPRLDSDLGLADQLAVTSDDLARCRPPAGVAVAATAHLLLHRVDLLEDEVPADLAGSLGLQDVLATGAEECERNRSDILPSGT